MSTRRRRGARLTRADFIEYRKYFYRAVPESNGARFRVWEPDGTFICETGLDDVSKVVDEDIMRKGDNTQMRLI